MIEALVTVDVQNDYFPGVNFPIWQPIEIATAISKLNQEEVQRRKEQEKDFPFFIEGIPGAKFHDLVKPLSTEKIVKKDENSSSFYRTVILKNISRLVSLGYRCVNEAVNTFDQEINGQLLQAKDIKKACLLPLALFLPASTEMSDISAPTQ
ncbi:hypothetical protein BD770DRAFT_444394 [Pilaira anomala]|nr:hypothetical protein BD770DRAFT_444394 [Pilaira anomala]